jgi:hypothetical protein
MEKQDKINELFIINNLKKITEILNDCGYDIVKIENSFNIECKRLKSLGYSIKDIKQLLKEDN